MEKLGESHPPPISVMARSGWRSSYVVVTTLLGTKMEINRLEVSESLDEALEIRRWGPSMEMKLPDSSKERDPSA